MNHSTNSTLASLIDYDAEGFERAIINCVLTDPDKYSHFLNMICGNPIDGRNLQEFTSRYRNLIFLCIKGWNSLVSNPTAVTSLTWEIIAILYKDQLVNYPYLGSPQEEMFIKAEWEAIKNAPAEMSVLCNQDALFTFWLERQRVTQLLSGSSKNPSKKLVDQLQMAVASASTSGKDLERRKFDLIDFSDVDVTQETSFKLMSTGEPELDRILDGGFYHGGAYMFLAPTGGGKTVFASQMALNAAALSSKNVLFITTEDKPRVLKMRMCSNWCDIPYDHIVKPGRVVIDNLRPVQKDRYFSLMEIIDKKMDFVDWSSSALATRDLPVLMEKYKEKKGHHPDFVIFDWIGGATDKSNPMFYRIQYQQQADYLAEFADQTQSVVVFNAQASAQAYVKKIISGEDSAENKTLQARCFGTLGLSALKRKDLGDDSGVQATYEERQYLSATKLRHGLGGTRSVLRDFRYQRLKFN
jgi:KaiC/GvpD/RAD55 family RecA-like ATPase